jgi:hypothetical protein
MWLIDFFNNLIIETFDRNHSAHYLSGVKKNLAKLRYETAEYITRTKVNPARIFQCSQSHIFDIEKRERKTCLFPGLCIIQ